jgi:hypothetical protein
LLANYFQLLYLENAFFFFRPIFERIVISYNEKRTAGLGFKTGVPGSATQMMLLRDASAKPPFLAFSPATIP